MVLLDSNLSAVFCGFGRKPQREEFAIDIAFAVDEFDFFR